MHEDATFKINNPAYCSMKILLHVFGLFRVYLVWRGSQKEQILKFDFCCIFKRFKQFYEFLMIFKLTTLLIPQGVNNIRAVASHHKLKKKQKLKTIIFLHLKVTHVFVKVFICCLVAVPCHYAKLKGHKCKLLSL